MMIGWLGRSPRRNGMSQWSLLLVAFLLLAAADARLGIHGDSTYLVVVDEDHSAEIGSLYRDITSVHNQVRVKHMYGAILKGFALSNLSESLAAILRQDSRVRGVYQDLVIDAETAPHSLDLDAVYARSEQDFHTYVLGSGTPDVAASWCQSFEDFTDENLPSRYHAPQLHNNPTTAMMNGHTSKSLLLHDIKVLEQQSGGTGYLGDVLAGLDHIAQEQVFHRNQKRIVVQLEVPFESALLVAGEEQPSKRHNQQSLMNLWNQAIQQATVMGMALIDASGVCHGPTVCPKIPQPTMETEAAMAHWTSLLKNTTSITTTITTKAAITTSADSSFANPSQQPLSSRSGKSLRSAHA